MEAATSVYEIKEYVVNGINKRTKHPNFYYLEHCQALP